MTPATERPGSLPPGWRRDRPAAAAGFRAAYVKQAVRDKLIDHKHYIRKQGDDMLEIRDWKWRQRGSASKVQAGQSTADNA